MRPGGDDGFTLIELMVALTLIALLASAYLLVSLTAMKTARANEGRTAATQIAQDYLEQVVAQPWSAIGLYASDSDFQSTANGQTTVTLTTSPRPSSVPVPLDKKTVGGIEYKIRTDITLQDDSSDGTGAADSDGNTKDLKHVVVAVSYLQNGLNKTVTVDGLRSATATEVPPSTGAGSLVVTVSAPATQTLTSAGYPSSAITVTATTSKSASSATLTYNTRSGQQSATMTSAAGTSWTATVPTTAGPFDTGYLTFGVSAKTASNGSASGSTNTQLIIGTGGAGLSVSAAPSQQLASGNVLSTPIVVTATGTTNLASASLSYATKTGTVSRTMSGSGTSFSYTIPADSTVYSAGSETFTIQATFSNATSGTGLVTISLYDANLPPDVTGITVNPPTGASTLNQFCVDKNYDLWSAQSIDITVSNVASTDTVKLTAPQITTLEFTASYLKTNANGSMVFRYSVGGNSSMPTASSIQLKAYATKTISGTSVRDDYITSPNPTILSTKQSSSCT